MVSHGLVPRSFDDVVRFAEWQRLSLGERYPVTTASVTGLWVSVATR